MLRKTNTPAATPMLFDDGDTPRHILRNILRTGTPTGFSLFMCHVAAVCHPFKRHLPYDSEHARSPVLHKKAEAEEPQPSSANSSITSKRPR